MKKAILALILLSACKPELKPWKTKASEIKAYYGEPDSIYSINKSGDAFWFYLKDSCIITIMNDRFQDVVSRDSLRRFPKGTINYAAHIFK